MIRRPPRSTLFPTRRSSDLGGAHHRTSLRNTIGVCQFLAYDDDMTLDIVNATTGWGMTQRSEEHTSELQSRQYLVCRLLLEKKKNILNSTQSTQISPILTY